jgi:hypothetical protein
MTVGLLDVREVGFRNERDRTALTRTNPDVTLRATLGLLAKRSVSTT